MKLKDIPATVVDACREREWSDEDIELLDPKSLFREYCEWHGLIGYGDSLYELVVALEKGRQK